ncbi:MAG: hypothetical protein ACRDPY_06490 [Streptosporangiaceae bacterium]
MATATVIVARKWGGWIGSNQKWQLLIDDAGVGSAIAVDQTVELPVEPGQHTLRLKTSGRLSSSEQTFEIADGEEIRFSCRAQFLWPLMLASLVRPDMWIRLRRDLRQASGTIDRAPAFPHTPGPEPADRAGIPPFVLE